MSAGTRMARKDSGVDAYRPLVSDWPAFAAAAARPEPTALRVRTGRIAPERLRQRLERQGFALEPVPGLPFLRLLEEPFPIAHTLEHWLGLFYLQQAVTGVAALALDPRPGERVLDLCAAPGGKTAHLAERMDDRGCVVAADRSGKRMRGLLGNVNRLAQASVLAVTADGRAFPTGARFDRVLVDAPCSGEGNLRRAGGRTRTRDPSFTAHTTALQEQLLRRGVALTRPGGVILYVTCTFAPAENEAVVSRVLAAHDLELEPIALDVPHDPGVTRFGDERFDARLARAWRLYPHHLDSGGLFLARLRKPGERPGDVAPHATGPRDDPGWEAVPPVFPGEALAPEHARARIAAAVRGLTHAFGVSADALAGRSWLVRGDNIWLLGYDRWPREAWQDTGRVRVLSPGLRAFAPGPGGADRPSNALLRWLNRGVHERVVTLDAHACLELLERGDAPAPGIGAGFAALRLEEWVIGRARVRAGRLHPEIPKAQARALRDVLRARAAATPGGSAGSE